jgi:hypothetical protein
LKVISKAIKKYASERGEEAAEGREHGWAARGGKVAE